MALFWSSQRRPAWVRYGAALIMVAAAGCCNYLMPPVYGESHYFFFSAAILASALFCGLGPGLLATAVSALVSAYLFVAPYHNFRVEAPEAAERLAMFVIEGAVISSVGYVIRENRTPEIGSAWGRYTVPVALVAGSAALKMLFLPTLERHVPYTFFYSAVVASSWVSGALAGLEAIVLSMACVHFLFLGAGAGTYPGDPSLVLFAVDAIVLCLLTAVFRQRLIETEAHLARVFEDSPIGILTIEGGAQIQKANPVVRQLLRANEADLNGRSLTDFVHPDSRERVRTFLADLMRQHTVGMLEEVCLVVDTAPAWANLRGSWIRETGRHAQTCMVTVEDITERRRIEEALREAEVRLQRGQRIEAIGMFAGGIAHDFNNLLTVIFGRCERLLFQKELPAEARGAVEEILETAKSAADLTRQLLTFARRQPRTGEVTQVNELVAESAALLGRLLGSRVELKTELEPGAGQALIDPSQLLQVLMNLAANARDAMPYGGRLTIHTSRTRSAGPQTADHRLTEREYVTLQVADTGHGMDEATRARIFEPLFSTKDLENGAGIGLATVHSIVTKLGGHIDVESSPGKGACFSIHLPGADLSQKPLQRLEQNGKTGGG